MNAEGLLRKQGWRGAGFSLDTSDRGIKKPLLISHKQDQLGLGKKKASHTTDDQWWMRAFDESLQNLGTGQKSTLSQIQEKGINRGGLYGFFVKGEGLKGSIGDDTSEPTSGTSTPPTSADEDKSTDEGDSDSESTSSNDTASDASKNPKSKKGQNKRKREAEGEVSVTKKLKQGTVAVKVSARAVADAEGEVQTGLGPISADDWPQVCAITSRIDKQAKARVKKNEKAGAYGDGTDAEDPKNSNKKLAKKAAKVEHQKVIRSAKKEMFKQLVIEAIVKGDLPMLNPESWSRDEISQSYGKIDKAIKAVENANKTSGKAERLAKREQRKDANAKAARGKARNKTEALRQSTVERHLAQLSPSKQAEYAARAAEKRQTLEEYTLRRIEKKEAKRAEKVPDKIGGGKALVETMGEPNDATACRAQKKAQRKLKREQKDQSANLAGKVKTKDKASQRARTNNGENNKGKTAGTNEGGFRDSGDDKKFIEKAAKFGAIAMPIAVSA